MLFYAVRSAFLAGDPLGDCVEVFVRRDNAERFLADCLSDEPGWRDVLSVVGIDLDG